METKYIIPGEFTIPDELEAEIKDGKVIVRKKESEDERIRKEIINFLNRLPGDGQLDQEISRIVQAKRLGDWLAYLEKQTEQNRAGWSEEDEKHLNWVIEHFSQAGELYHDLINWLKSLRPQSQWKPSEAQFDALWAALGVADYVAGAWIENGGERSLGMSKAELHDRLISLYRDLKDL